MQRSLILVLLAACSARAPALHSNPVVKVEYVGTRPLTRAELQTRQLPPWYKERYLASGSGFFANGAGDIVTNYHVVVQAGMETSQVVVTVDGEWRYPAKILRLDKALDLAVVRIDADAKTSLPTLALGSPAAAGASVRLQGYPQGGPFTQTEGVVTRLGPLLECTAPVRIGNSGGPVLSEEETVVGVVTGMRRRTFSGSTGSVAAEFCLVIPVTTIRDLLSRWHVPHR